MSRKSVSSTSVSPLFSIVRAALIVAVTLIWFGLFAVMGIDTHHDGVMLAPAVTVARGGAPFADTFCQYGLLPPLLQGLAIRLFGGEVIVLRLLALLFYCGSALLLDRVSRHFLPGKWSWLTLAIFWLLVPDTIVTTHPWSSVFALFFMLTEAELMIAFFEKGFRKYLFFSGIAAFLAFASRHPCGMVTVFAALMTLLIGASAREPGKRGTYFCSTFGLYLAGFFAAAIPAACYLSIVHAWKDYFLQCWGFILCFVWRRGGEGSWHQLGESFFPLTGQNWFFDAVFSALPLTALLMLWGAVRSADGNGEKLRRELPLISLLLLGLGSWHQYYPVPCVRHLFWGAAPLFPVYALAIRRVWNRRKILAAVLILLLVMAAGIRLYAGAFRIRSLGSRRRVDLPCVHGLMLTRREAAELLFWHNTVSSLPPELYRRGIVNLTQEAFWQDFFPQCALHHPIPMRMIQCPYPERDAEFLRFAIEHRCAILADAELPVVPGFAVVAEAPCNLHDYRLWVPAEEIVFSAGDPGSAQ